MSRSVYAKKPKDCVCGTWDRSLPYPRVQGHHEGCRVLYDLRCLNLTPALAFERYGTPLEARDEIAARERR